MDRKSLRQAIVEYTRMLTPIADMAVLLDMPESDLRTLLSNPDDDIAKAFRRTKAEVALDIRKRDIEMAAAGSPTAAVTVSNHLAKILSDD